MIDCYSTYCFDKELNLAMGGLVEWVRDPVEWEPEIKSGLAPGPVSTADEVSASVLTTAYLMDWESAFESDCDISMLVVASSSGWFGSESTNSSLPVFAAKQTLFIIVYSLFIC